MKPYFPPHYISPRNFQMGWAVSIERHLVQGTRHRKNGTPIPTTIRHLVFDTRFQNPPFTHCCLLFHQLYFFLGYIWWGFLLSSFHKRCTDFFLESVQILKSQRSFCFKIILFLRCGVKRNDPPLIKVHPGLHTFLGPSG